MRGARWDRECTHVGAAEAEAALELGVDHVAAAGDVLLVVRDVLVHALPAGHHHGLGAVALAEGGGRGAELVARDAGDRLFGLDRGWFRVSEGRGSRRRAHAGRLDRGVATKSRQAS